MRPDAVVCVAAPKPVQRNESTVWCEDALTPVGSRTPELPSHCRVAREGQPDAVLRSVGD